MGAPDPPEVVDERQASGSSTALPASSSSTLARRPNSPPAAEVANEDEGQSEILEGRLLDDPLEPPETSPWAGLGETLGRAAVAVPGVPRAVLAVNWVLGPRKRRAPRPPTGLSLMFTLTGGRRRVSAPLDALCVRLTRKLKLRYFYLLFLAVWIAANVLLIRGSYYWPNAPTTIGCTDSLWDDWPPDACGLDGAECTAYLQDGTYKCPGGCQNVALGNPRWVGGEKINRRPLLIGGGDDAGTYRGDSWICAAGIQRGLISRTYGGCITVKAASFPLGSSRFIGAIRGGLKSIGFGPHHPAAYTLSSGGSLGACIEYHWPVTAFNVIMLFVFTAFFAPPPGVLASTLVILGYGQIILFSDPPYRPPSWVFTLQGVPLALLAGFWAWHVALRRTLTGFRAAKLPLETALWQGFGFWIGIESSTLFAKIPISRLGYGPLGADGVIALLIIILLVCVVVFIQAMSFRRLGLVRYYLVRYLPLVPILVVLGNLGHGYYLRLHHYLLSLAALPVMSLPNRISLFGQSFFLGFFLDGVGRWGWASIVEHIGTLIGDAPTGSFQPILASTADTISWPALNATLIGRGVSGVAVLLDDILIRDNFLGTSFRLAEGTADTSVDHYLRLAYIGNGTSMDYTDPITWHASNQSWTQLNSTAVWNGSAPVNESMLAQGRIWPNRWARLQSHFSNM